MSDSTRELLIMGIDAAKRDSKEEARHYLEWLLRDDSAEDDEIVEAWRWLAKVSDDPKEKRNCLEQVIAHNPMDPEAPRELAILDGTLNPADLVDPDRMPAPTAPTAPTPIEARRFVCANCGGRMSFTPDTNALTCNYCGNRQSLLVGAVEAGAALPEQGFSIALATAKGHSIPIATQAIKCSGCGASFVLSPTLLSQVCPYCGSPYVVEQTETHDLIPPEGIVPFSISREAAQRTALDWYRSNNFKILSVDALPNGVYLPYWTFDLGGVIEWSCLVQIADTWMPEPGSQLVAENNMLIAASHTLSAPLTREVETLTLEHLVPFDARYLADCPAETYQISVSDASIVARARALANTAPLIQAGITSNYRNLHPSTMKLVVDSYKLVILPLWITRYHFENKWYNVAINGQTGRVSAEKPHEGAFKWVEDLLDGK